MITTTEVASLLGITPRTVQRHIKAGHLKATKYGRDFLITQEELERFKQERKPVGRPKRIQVQSSHVLVKENG